MNKSLDIHSVFNVWFKLIFSRHQWEGRYHPCVCTYTHNWGKKTEGAEGELWPGLGPNAGEAWITMRQCPWNLRALSWRGWAGKVLAVGKEMKSHHQKKMQLQAAKGCRCAIQGPSIVRDIDQWGMSFSWWFNAFTLNIRKCLKNMASWKWKMAFPYKYSPC